MKVTIEFNEDSDNDELMLFMKRHDMKSALKYIADELNKNTSDMSKVQNIEKILYLYIKEEDLL